MSSDIAISVENLSKRYRLMKQDKQPLTLGRILTTPYRRFKEIQSLTTFDENDESVFWALKEINFELKRGEILGIIGKNGAGKSTLLKILSKITSPTTGRIVINGRVNSLLEVGTGFNPELTGRENIYMNGTLHGMSKREIDSKLDEIIDFAGVEDFIDTPLKRYSSGMGVRLGFAVAAHLEPEILIIDEVLAVGDAEFQKKCTGKMSEVAQKGRTILFVSHNMASVTNLCSRGIVLENGQVIEDASAAQAVSTYLKKYSVVSEFKDGVIDLRNHNGRWEQLPQEVKITYCKVENEICKDAGQFQIGKPNTLRFGYEVNKDIKGKNVIVGFKIFNDKGELITYITSDVAPTQLESLSGTGEVSCRIPKLPLLPGNYSIDVFTRVQRLKSDIIEGAFQVEASGDEFFPDKRLPDNQLGQVYFEQEWEHKTA